MKTFLFSSLIFFLFSNGLAQGHATKECTDECIFGVRSKLRECTDVLSEEGCHPVEKAKVGFLKYGEVISETITIENGSFVLPIPNYNESDLYSVNFFYAYNYHKDTTNNDMDTLLWDCLGCYKIINPVVCLKHGKKDEIILPRPNQAEETVKIHIFPVPTNDLLNIKFSVPFSGNISLISITGTQVFSKRLTQQENETIDVAHLSGIFIVQIIGDDNKIQQLSKVIII